MLCYSVFSKCMLCCCRCKQHSHEDVINRNIYSFWIYVPRSIQFAIHINYVSSHMSIHILKSILNILEFMIRAPRLIKSKRHFPCLQRNFVWNFSLPQPRHNLLGAILFFFFFSSVTWHSTAFLCKGYVKYICHHIYKNSHISRVFVLSFSLLFSALSNTNFSIKNAFFFFLSLSLIFIGCFGDIKCLIFR